MRKYMTGILQLVVVGVFVTGVMSLATSIPTAGAEGARVGADAAKRKHLSKSPDQPSDNTSVLFLVCKGTRRSPEYGGAEQWRADFSIDIVHQTVNGKPAQITNALVSWEWQTHGHDGHGYTNVMYKEAGSISRLSGAYKGSEYGMMGTQFEDSVSEVVSAQCQPAARQF